MDATGIARLASDMKTMQLQSEMSVRVLKMTMDVAAQEGEELVEMIDSILTGAGQNIDISI